MPLSLQSGFDMMKFSPATALFYDPQINAGGIPDDAVDITREVFETLLAARSTGQIIEAGKDGLPVARKPEPPAPPTLDELKTLLVTRATAHRWNVETGGISLPNGARVATSKDDQDRITSVLVNAQTAGIESIEFKAVSGWLSLTLPELRGVVTAVALHVQACFSAERQHHEAIAALTTLADAQSYDLSTDWPQQPLPAQSQA